MKNEPGGKRRSPARGDELLEIPKRRFEADRRYGKVFVYHNGAESYYAARGGHGALRA